MRGWDSNPRTPRDGISFKLPPDYSTRGKGVCHPIAATSLQRKRRRRIYAIAAVAFVVLFMIFILFPPPALLVPANKKPIILYYHLLQPPLQVSQFPDVVNFTLQHGFNTLMMVIFNFDEASFNRSTIDYFISYAESKGLTFVPSYYIRSTSDQINVSGLAWVNLDMERLNSYDQRVFYDRIAQIVPLVSVTSPYGQPVGFHTPMRIIETYATSPLFWLDQLGYYHPGKICSVAAWLLNSQQEYDAQKDYCLKYSDGVMVFDYYSLLKSGFS
jgi:hypothetical protein